MSTLKCVIAAAAMSVAAAAIGLGEANAQITGLEITPPESCNFVGPQGGPFTPTSCDYELVNSTGTAITVGSRFTVLWEPPWLEAIVDGEPAPQNDFEVTVPANGSIPFTLQLTEDVAGVTDPDNLGLFGGIEFFDLAVPQRSLSVAGNLVFVAGNDLFVGAQSFDRVVTSVSGNNTGATKEDGEPNHAGNPGGASVWYRYVAPTGGAGSLDIEVESADFDSLLAVYTGTRVDALTQVVANDNRSGSTLSAVSFEPVPGQTYFIALDSKSSNGSEPATGNFQIQYTERLTLLNDDFADAVEITGASGSISQFADGFVQPTREDSEPPHGGGFGGSTWLRWRAPSSEVYEFTAGGTGFGSFPVIAIYLGDSVDDLTEVASTTILADATNSLELTAVADAEYAIALAGGGLTSPYDVSWRLSRSDRPRGLFAAILPSSRAVGLGETAGVFASMVNTTAIDGLNCRPEAPNALNDVTPNGFDYQTTNLANQLVGTLNTPVDIPAGETQSWVLYLNRAQIITKGRQGIRFTCDNLATAPIYPAANTWILRVLSPPPADIIAIGATLTTPGVVEPPVGGISVFTVAGVNIGVPAPITVRPTATIESGIALTVCETDTAGQCVAPPAGAVSVPAFGEGEVRFFSVFVQALGDEPIAFDPGLTRVSLDFLQGQVLVGSTGVALRTVDP